MLLQPHDTISVASNMDHEKILEPTFEPHSSRAEFLLSKNCTPTLLTVPSTEEGFVRQYRLSCNKGSLCKWFLLQILGNVKYYRCSKCDYICRKLHLKFQSYVKVKDGQVITDLETVEHHPNCHPIPALQAIAKDIDRYNLYHIKKIVLGSVV